MAIMWDAPHARHEAAETAADIAWRMFLVQTLTGLTEDAETPAAKAAAQHGGRLIDPDDDDRRAA